MIMSIQIMSDQDWIDVVASRLSLTIKRVGTTFMFYEDVPFTIFLHIYYLKKIKESFYNFTINFLK